MSNPAAPSAPAELGSDRYEYMLGPVRAPIPYIGLPRKDYDRLVELAAAALPVPTPSAEPVAWQEYAEHRDACADCWTGRDRRDDLEVNLCAKGRALYAAAASGSRGSATPAPPTLRKQFLHPGSKTGVWFIEDEGGYERGPYFTKEAAERDALLPVDDKIRSGTAPSAPPSEPVEPLNIIYPSTTGTA